MKPAETFSLPSAKARVTWLSDRPWACSLAGESTTWNCFTPPPMGVTCETPGTERMRRRITVSAVVRSSMGVCLSEVREMKRISPMMEDTGASTGRSTSGGSSPAATLTFSLTICRAA